MLNPYLAPAIPADRRPPLNPHLRLSLDILGASCAGLPLLFFAGFTALFLARRGILDRYEDVLAVVLYITLFLGFLGGIYNVIRSIQRSWLGILGLVFNGITIALIAFSAWVAAVG